MRELIKPFEEGLEWVVVAAVMAVAVLILVWLVDKTAGRRLAPSFRYWLWMLVAVRLLMPVAPQSSLSVQQAWDLLTWETQATEQLAQKTRPPLPEPLTPIEAQALAERLESQKQATTAQPKTIDWDEVIFWCLIITWPSGVAFALLRAVYSSLRFAWRLRALEPVEDPSVVDVVLHACDQVGVLRPTIKRVPGLPSPALFGLFRPTLCLPSDCELSPTELRLVALHEATHLRRRDSLTAWLLTMVRALHWMNPAAWLSVRQIEHYREQACDANVWRFANPDQRRMYADLLLRFSAASPATNLGLLGLWMTRPARDLQRRLDALAASQSPKRVPSVVACVLIILVGLASLTDASSADADSQPTASAPVELSPEFQAKLKDAQVAPLMGYPNSEGEKSRRQYDLTKTLAKIAETRPEEEDPRNWLLKYLYLPGLERAVVLSGDNPNLVSVSATREGHAYFKNLLEEVKRFGATWQVTASVRVVRLKDVEEIPGIDWQEAVRFAAPDQAQEASLPLDDNLVGNDLSASMETVAYRYTPYLAALVDQRQVNSLYSRLRSNPNRSLLTAPKVTLFSGQTAGIRDESLSPFVVGVGYIRGENATAAQPNIAVLPEGMRIDFRPRVVDRDSLDLHCRVTMSFIEDVNNTRLPGQEITIQAPQAMRRSITVHSRVKRGQTLLTAPLAGHTDDSNGGSFCFAITPEWFMDPAKNR